MTCVGTVTEQRRCLLSALLDRATRAHDLSRRQLAAQLGVAVGTVNNYYLGKVDPLNCRLLIQQRLAELNGSTVDELWRFYATGDWGLIGLRDPLLIRPIQKGLRRRRGVSKAAAMEEPSPLLQAGIRSLLRKRGAASKPLPSSEEIEERMEQPMVLFGGALAAAG